MGTVGFDGLVDRGAVDAVVGQRRLSAEFVEWCVMTPNDLSRCSSLTW